MSYDITSTANPKVKWLIRLGERRHRDVEGLFLVEGPRLYKRAVSAGMVPRVTFTDGTEPGVGETVTVSPEVLDRISYRKRSEGIIGVFPQFEVGLDRLELSAPPLILVAEDIEKPGNLGAMMRTAAAAGADALIAVGGHVDPFNPNAVRSSTGALFSLPLAATTWEEATSWLDQRGVAVIAASPSGGLPHWSADLSGPVALVIGAEDSGLSERAAAIATQTVVIPQVETGVDSLNASVAAGILLFEAVRQRSDGAVAPGRGEERP